MKKKTEKLKLKSNCIKQVIFRDNLFFFYFHLRMCVNNCNRFSSVYASAYTRVRRIAYHLYEVRNMLIKDAVVLRLQNICRERNLRYNELATRSGVTPSTVYSLMDETRRDVSITTLKKLCDGLDMTITEFFDDKIFTTLEQEMK